MSEKLKISATLKITESKAHLTQSTQMSSKITMDLLIGKHNSRLFQKIMHF